MKRAFEPAKERVITQKTPDIELLEQQLTENLQAPIAIKHNAKGKGKLTISYKNLAELDKIIDLINS
ncbi:MAG: hypothetical protein MJK04_12325 [Psychrosphaera sp.]|nr:hypothetical protein [Psychrosphaera sp.]